MKKNIVGLMLFMLIVAGGRSAMAAASHVVKPGETLWLISQQYQTTVDELAKANYLDNPHLVLAGERLLIPGRGVVHMVLPGETLWLIAQKYGTTVEIIAAENEIADVDMIEAGRRLVIPFSGELKETAGGEPVSMLASRSGREFSPAELDLFARLVHAEAAGEPYLGQVAVAASVLNRLASPLYPNTLTGVICQVVNGYYQYSPVLDGRINLPAGESAWRAIFDAIGGMDPSLGATGFYNPKKTSNQWVRQQPVTTVIGNHVFFK